MRALSIVHQSDAGSGVFGEEMRARGIEVETWEPALRPGPAADARDYDALLAFGGAMHVDAEAQHPWLRAEKELLRSALEAGVPVMGVCLGAQLLGEAAGAPARRAVEPEIGWYRVDVTGAGASDPVIGPLAPRFEAFQWHSYEVPPPPGSVALARSPVCLQAYRIGSNAWGIQFHAEVSSEDAELWFDGWEKDPDAVRMGIDPEALRAQTREAIADWNQVGRELCGRFLEAVSTPA